jgi:hypothetical protein
MRLGKTAKKGSKNEERQNIYVGLSKSGAFLLAHAFANFRGQSDLIIA